MLTEITPDDLCAHGATIVERGAPASAIHVRDFLKLKLPIEAEVSSGLDRAKVRTLVGNANTLGFIEKSVE